MSFILSIFLAPARIAAQVSEAQKDEQARLAAGRAAPTTPAYSLIVNSPASRTAASAYGPTSTRQRPGSTRQPPVAGS